MLLTGVAEMLPVTTATLLVLNKAPFKFSGSCSSRSLNPRCSCDHLSYIAAAMETNAIFIIIFASVIGSFWVWWKNKGKEYSGVFKMAIGVIIMGWGFFFMSAASNEVQYDSAGEIVEKSAM